MILHEAVAKLATLVPVLKSNDAKFASDLIASYKKYGGLTAKQEPWIERLIARAEAPKPVAVAAPVHVVGSFAGVIALFNKAKEHLKFPKVRLVVNGVKITLSVNGPKSKKPGFISISGEGVYPNRAFYGTVSPEGEFLPSWNKAPEFTTALTALLTEFAANPARVAKDHGKLTGNCCFCNKVLGLGKEKRSVLVGFGPDCAEHYGLKAEWLAAAEKAEAKASVTPVVSAFDVTPESQAKVLIDTAAATLPVLSVQDEVKASLEAGFVDDNPKDETVYDAPVVVALPTIEELANAPVSEEFKDSYGPNPGDVGDLEPVTTTPETAVEWAASVTAAKLATPVDCFFCEKPTANYKTLHGFVVCGACVDQLK